MSGLHVAYRNSGLRSPISANVASVYFALTVSIGIAALLALIRFNTTQYTSEVMTENAVTMTRETENPVVYWGASEARKMFDPRTWNRQARVS